MIHMSEYNSDVTIGCFILCASSVIDRRGFVVPDCTMQYLHAKCNPHKSDSTESNAVNNVWHESYGATTTTHPQVCNKTVSISGNHLCSLEINTKM